jgi:glucan phosphoethanolaminetransferase (alkaline phosphatase superfamily)
MIQRIQTVYYTLAILLLAIPLMGMNIVSFSTADWSQAVTFYGNRGTEAAEAAELVPLPDLPLYLLNLIIIILLLIAILSYKSLKRQQFLGKIALWSAAIAILVLGFAVFNFYQYMRVLKPVVEVGAGFWMVLFSIPFILLGNGGVRKDRKLLDSLNRLR